MPNIQIKNYKEQYFKPFYLTSMSLISIGLISIASFSLSADEPSIELSLLNDSTHRGVSLSNGMPGLAISIDNNFSNHYYAGFNIFRQKTSTPYRRKGWNSTYIGAFNAFNNDSAVSLSLIHYHFSEDFLYSRNYLELQADYHISQTATLSYSVNDNYYGLDIKGNTLSFNWHPQISPHWFVATEFGVTDIPDTYYSNNIEYINLSLVYSFDSWSFQIGHAYADRDAEFLHGNNSAGNRFLVSASYQVY